MKAFHHVIQFDDSSDYKLYDVNWSSSDNIMKYHLTVYTNIGTLCVL